MIEQPPAQWNGVPPEPEKDGWRWLHNDVVSIALRWHAGSRCWIYGAELRAPIQIVERGWIYAGRCLTPTEVAERGRAAELRGFEEAIEWLEQVPNKIPAQHSFAMNADVIEDLCRALRAKLAQSREAHQIAQEAACSDRTIEGYVDNMEEALTKRQET